MQSFETLIKNAEKTLETLTWAKEKIQDTLSSLEADDSVKKKFSDLYVRAEAQQKKAAEVLARLHAEFQKSN